MHNFSSLSLLHIHFSPHKTAGHKQKHLLSSSFRNIFDTHIRLPYNLDITSYLWACAPIYWQCIHLSYLCVHVYYEINLKVALTNGSKCSIVGLYVQVLVVGKCVSINYTVKKETDCCVLQAFTYTDNRVRVEPKRVKNRQFS